MRKVLVIGSGGSGKSTFARRLGKLLDIEVIHLDRLHWKPGWTGTPKDEWARTVGELARRDSWVMDGNYSGTLDIRLAACDTVVFMDMPRRVCLWRVLKRLALYREGSRPDMAEGCAERFDLEFMLWIWNYPATRRPKVLEKLRALPTSKRVVRLRSSAEAEKFLAEVSGVPERASV